jgi:hypothetical protein
MAIRKSTVYFLLFMLFVVSLFGSIILDKFNAYNDEIDWYVAHLDYDFHAQVDSLGVFHTNGNGFLYCSQLSGKLDFTREDSLGLHVKEYDRLRFLRFEGSMIKIFSGSTDSFQPGDRIYVNSDKGCFQIFRDGQMIRDYVLRDTVLKKYL